VAARVTGKMLLAEVAKALNALPDVFSTAQWGGRAYKLPRGGSGRPKLLAHVTPVEDDEGVTVSFKLPPAEAADQVERYDWIAPHSFRTLAPSGWVTAHVRTKRQLGALRKLLVESHALQHTAAAPSRSADSTTEAARIDQVLRDAAGDGWTPQSDW
jgi:predicted DNA-binding protein (MmcQ/YjbR family)